MKRTDIALLIAFIITVILVGAYYLPILLDVRIDHTNISERYSNDMGNGQSESYVINNDTVNSDLQEHLINNDNGTDFRDNYLLQDNQLSLAFVGDILLGSSVGGAIKIKGPDYIFKDISEILKGADFTVGNLECAISSRGIPEQNKQYLFKAEPDSAQIIATAGIDAVSLANNHVLDFGLEALNDTFENLELNAIKYAGAGKDVETASKAIYTEVKGVKLALIASSHVIPFVSWTAGVDKPGVASAYNPVIMCREITKARENADIVIAYLHWGTETSNIAERYQRNLAKSFIDSGADIVVGSHPHVIQGLEYYKDGIIIYSLGNFVFTNMKRDTMIAKVSFDGKLKNKCVQIIPCEIRNYAPYIIRDEQRVQAFFNDLSSISYDVSINDQGLVINKVQTMNNEKEQAN